MLFRLFLLFTLLPLIELTLLAWMSAHTDWRLTVAFVIGTGVLGAALIRSQGWRAWRRIRDELARGQVPTDSIQDGLLILVAGLLLITPGVLSDLVGVLLLVPWVRRAVRRWLRRRWQLKFDVRMTGSRMPDRPGERSHPHGDRIIDVTSTPVDSADAR
ncbi:MAG TPA: FxsA family protein [Pirellulales bacterium]|nr:FxsA family protein [Pirellulales bacterium]